MGGDIDVLNMRAFNTMGSLVDHSVVIDHFEPSGASISVIGADIAYVSVNVNAAVSGLYYDDLAYNIVPAPASAAILTLGMLGYSRRRNRHHKTH